MPLILIPGEANPIGEIASTTISLADQSGAAGHELSPDNECWMNASFDSSGSYEPGHFADCSRHIR